MIKIILKKGLAALMIFVCLFTTLLSPPGGAAATNPFSVEMARKMSVSVKLTLNCLPADMTAWYESHGGFHGDGTTFYRLEFPHDSNVKAIQRSKKWHELPMTDEIEPLSFITIDNDWEHRLIPSVEHGYYCFIDSYSMIEKDPVDGTMERYYLNYTIAVYDTDNNILYYGVWDS